MQTCKLIADKYGNLHTPRSAADPEYLEFCDDGGDQIIAAYYQGDPATLREDSSEEMAQYLLFDLFETGQVDYKVYSRTVEFPNGRKVTV